MVRCVVRVRRGRRREPRRCVVFVAAVVVRGAVVVVRIRRRARRRVDVQLLLPFFVRRLAVDADARRERLDAVLGAPSTRRR